MSLVATNPDEPGRGKKEPKGSDPPPITWKYLEALGYREQSQYTCTLSPTSVCSVFIRDKRIATCTTRAEFRDFLAVSDVAWEETKVAQLIEASLDERDWKLLAPRTSQEPLGD